MNVLDFDIFKKTKKKISMVTCYDFWSARIVAESNVDCVLVGDSLAMVMHGHTTTLKASLTMMCAHIEAVRKGAPKKFLVGDLPFLSYRKDLSDNMTAVEQLAQAGAEALKLEGAGGNIEFIKHCVESGVPMMGHLGLTPQSIHQLGGFRVQGRGGQAELLFEDALRLEDAGCFAVVLECVPHQIAQKITARLHIPTIGIGAGVECDGQVLVLQDLLGMNPEFKPRFLRSFLNGFDLLKQALDDYDASVKSCNFPSPQESYE
jgi:3-methyl-2-oxobutanoate hydroxymethyltransferase